MCVLFWGSLSFMGFVHVACPWLCKKNLPKQLPTRGGSRRLSFPRALRPMESFEEILGESLVEAVEGPRRLGVGVGEHMGVLHK